MRNKLMFTTLLECVLHFSADQGLVDRLNPNFNVAIKVLFKLINLKRFRNFYSYPKPLDFFGYGVRILSKKAYFLRLRCRSKKVIFRSF